MYPSLYHLIYDVFGIEIPILKIVMVYGFFVFLGFLSAYLTIRSELIRCEDNNILDDIVVKNTAEKSTIRFLLSALLGFIISWKLSYFITNYNEVLNNFGSFIYSLNGNFWWGCLGAIILVFTNYIESFYKTSSNTLKTKTIKPHSLLINIVFIAGIFGLLGANLFAAFENLSSISSYPTSELGDNLKGGSFLGGLIVGLIGVFFYARRLKLDWKILADFLAPGLMLSYGVGRIGCHLSGDGDWGIENSSPKPDFLGIFPDWAWSFDFPGNVIGVKLDIPVWPTSLYESLICIALFFLIWVIRKKTKYVGVLFSIYLILAGLERFFIEFLRVNRIYETFNIYYTQAQFISIILILLGIAGLYYFPFYLKQNYRKPINHKA